MIKLYDIFKGDFPQSQPYGGDHFLTINGQQIKASIYYGRFGLKGHEGVDWATLTGTPIIAPFSGVVLRQDFQIDYKNYGKVVVLWDPVQKCAVWFCHLSEEFVNAGQTVNKGQILGKTGATGNTTGPHLHFNLVETDQYGNRLNTGNGYLGFVNALDPNLVKWELGTPLPLTCEQRGTQTKDICNKQGISDTDKLNQIRKLWGV